MEPTQIFHILKMDSYLDGHSEMALHKYVIGKQLLVYCLFVDCELVLGGMEWQKMHAWYESNSEIWNNYTVKYESIPISHGLPYNTLVATYFVKWTWQQQLWYLFGENRDLFSHASKSLSRIKIVL